MKIKPMLGSFALDGIECIESYESRALVEHRVPGLAGNYFQDMGSVPNAILIMGSKHGDEARDAFLSGIREIFNKGEPTTFVADINTATDITDVIIEDLQVSEVGANPYSFRYLIKIRKYIKPPEPPSTDLLDTSILDDALGMMDALNTLDALSSISNLGDPTPPLGQALDAVKAATSGLDSIVNNLNALFTKGVPASPPLAPGEGGAAPGTPAPAEPAPTPAVGEAAPPAAVSPPPAVIIDPADPKIEGATGPALQQLLAAPETAPGASGLVQCVLDGSVTGIFGEDAEVAQQLAAAYGTQPSQLIPAGQDAALILDPASPLEGPPTILLRSGVRDDPARLEAALQAVGRTLDLFDLYDLASCASTTESIPVPNLVPATFCLVPIGVPGIPPGPASQVKIDPGDPRIDSATGTAIQQLLSTPKPTAAAIKLVQGFQNWTLTGIFREDAEAAQQLAAAHGTQPSQLIPVGKDAALILDTTFPLEAPPTILLRSGVSDDPGRLDAALQAVGKTFDLFQQQEIGPCDSTATAIPIPNLVPSTFCQVPTAVPGITPGPAPEEEPAEIDPSAPDLQIDPGDPRIDVGAKFALQRMIKNPDMAVDAARLIRGINGGTLAGIYGDDLGAAVQVAHAHGTERWLLVPKGEDAALVMDAAAPLEAPPTVIFRGDTPDIRSTPTRIDPALQKASQTFGLFQEGKLAPCDSMGSAIPVSNLVPPSFCQVTGGDLIVVVTEEGIDPNLPWEDGAQVQVESPTPSTEQRSKVTDETRTAIFPGLAFGSYRVTARKEGFEDASTEIVHPSDQVQKASFASGSTLQSIGFRSSVLLQLKPASRVESYITTIAPGNVDDPAPALGKFQKVASGQSAIMHVLAGSHTAVTLLNVSGPISSNNYNVIEDKDIIEVPRGANRRDLFFYCKNLVDPNHYNPDTTLLELPIQSGKWPLVQIRVYKIVSQLPRRRSSPGQPSSITKCMLIKLYGSSMLLNGWESLKSRPYEQIQNCYNINPHEFANGVMSPKDVIDLIIREVGKIQKKENSQSAKLNHLVINCHGYPHPTNNNYTLWLGTGFDINHFSEWNRLNNMVDYIWFMACASAPPFSPPDCDQLFGGIAMATGAWVTRWEGYLWLCPWGNWPTNHIDYYHNDPTPKHYDPNAGNTIPVQPDSFFRSARYAKSGQFKSDLHFNIVPDSRMNYP